MNDDAREFLKRLSVEKKGLSQCGTDEIAWALTAIKEFDFYYHPFVTTATTPRTSFS